MGNLDEAQASKTVHFELQRFSAVVVGGTYLFGGFMSVNGFSAGALIIALIGNGLLIENVNC